MTHGRHTVRDKILDPYVVTCLSVIRDRSTPNTSPPYVSVICLSINFIHHMVYYHHVPSLYTSPDSSPLWTPVWVSSVTLRFTYRPLSCKVRLLVQVSGPPILVRSGQPPYRSSGHTDLVSRWLINLWLLYPRGSIRSHLHRSVISQNVRWLPWNRN